MLRRVVRPLLVIAVAAATPGCDLIQGLMAGEVELPVPFETPAQEVNATDRVTDLEGTICADMTSTDCLVLQAIDRTDDEAVSDPPSMPDEFPAEVDVDDDPGTDNSLNVEEWAKDQGFGDVAADLKVAVPVDLSDEVPAEQRNKIKSVTVTKIGVNFTENTLTFPTVPLDVYVSEGEVDSLDAQELLDNGDVKKVGTISAQPAGEDGVRDIDFVAGGNEIFNTALKSLKFTMVTALPEGADVGLPRNDAGDKVIKPQGITMVSLKGEITFTISTAEVAEAVDDATE